jgi:hypothetical protein
MNDNLKLEIHATSMVQGNNHRRTLVQELNKQLPSNAAASPDNRDEGALYSLTTAMLTSVGTVAVSNPQIILEVISVIQQNDQLVVNTISGLEGTPFVTINVDEVNIDLSIFKIDNKTEIDDSKVIIEADSSEEAEEIREHIRQE